MNAEQVAAVVAKIRIGDNRETSPEVILEWLDTIGHLRFEDAIAAVKLHRQESTAYLMPAHVIANARRVSELRAVNAGGVYCDTHAWYPLPCDRCADDDRMDGAA
jgi:hypothetical protein